MVRATLSEATAIDPSRTVVKAFRNGKAAFDISPKKTPGPVSTVDFLCDNLKACGSWAAGTYTFQVYINGTGAEVIESFPFVAGTSVRILAVAVKANYGTKGIKSVAGDKWKKLEKFFQNVYPLADGGLKWTIRPEVLDASSAPFNLEKSDWTGCSKLSNALSNLIPAACETNPQDKGCYDFVVGFINESLTMDDKTTTLAGFAYTGSRAVVAVAGDDDAPGTIAHEIAHQYGIGDTYDDEKLSSIRCSVNPAPDGFKGLNWDTGLKTVTSCTSKRPASTLKRPDDSTVNGAQVPEAVHPYEISGRGALPEMADFMSAGGTLQSQMWITQDVYDWLYRRLVLQDQTLSKVSKILSAPGSSQRFLRFSGYLSTTDQIDLNPWKSFTNTAAISDTTGSLMVRAVNGANAVVASAAFTVQFFMTHPPRTLDRAPFSGVIRFPADTVKFQIVKDGSVLDEVPVSANAPTVSNVTPAGTTALSGPYTVTWNGSDPDGGDVTYTVEYNPDVTNSASAWMVLAEDLDTRSWQEDFSLLPGGAHAKIRVTADDGVLTAIAESAEFNVPLKKPELFIDELPWGTSYPAGSDVLLTARAFDPQDEWLAGDQLRWTSNLSGELGSGSELIVRNLVSGTHIITLTATNSAGLTTSDTVTVQIGSSGGSRSPCFIATAAFGSGFDPCVNLLRDFRDRILMVHGAGRAFVAWYYRISPPIAAFIAGSDALRAVVRVMLLPAVGFSILALRMGFFWSMALLLALLALAGAIISVLVRNARKRV